ncbi:MAG: glycerol-3-phosphate 1-O-acyltransferase [Pseudomonadales bacterium]
MSDTTSQTENPWPSTSSNELVFILDCANKVEEQLLRNWISDSQTPDSPEYSTAVIHLTAGRGEIDSKDLASKLEQDNEVLLAPVRVVWIPEKDFNDTKLSIRDFVFGDPRRPPAFRAKQILQKSPNRAICVAAAPGTIGELKQRFSLLQHSDQQNVFAPYVAQQAGISLDVAERRLQGGRYKVPRYVSQNLTASKAFNDDVAILAKNEDRDPADLMKESAKYMKEMISIPSTFYLDLYAKFNKYVLGLGYEDEIVCDKNDIEKMRTLVRENPALLLWTHKTYLDGMVLPRVLYDNDFPTPHMFGGANMNFLGLGYLLRRAGAIFIRRTFQDNPLYKLTLRHYIGYLMQKRFPMSWAFEGTRSRLGKLMPPRYGLLKYVLEACYEAGSENIHIIPISISYDIIRDVDEYATEQTGRAKSAESLSWFIGYIASLRKPMGRAYMDMGEPVILATAPDPNDSLALSKVAFEVAVAANKVTPITLPSIVCMSLLGAAPQAITTIELKQAVQALHDWAQIRGIRISSDFQPKNALHTQKVLDLMVDEGMVARYDEGPDEVYGIAPEQHPVASYYRNTVIHFFVNKAIIELSLLAASDAPAENASETFWSEVDRLRDLFKFEFFYAPTEEFHQEIRQELTRCDAHWEAKIGGGQAVYLQLFECMTPLVAHTVLLTYAEAYTVVSDLLARLKPGETMDQKTVVDTALKYGRQAYMQRRISSEASIGKILFKNAYQLFSHRNLTEGEGSELAEKRIASARELHDLIKQLNRIAAIANAR